MAQFYKDSFFNEDHKTNKYLLEKTQKFWIWSIFLLEKSRTFLSLKIHRINSEILFKNLEIYEFQKSKGFMY